MNTPFVIERTYNVPAANVWDAITNNEKMRQWYFQLPEFRAEVGFEFRFDGGPDGRAYHHICRITEVVPGQKLRHSWQYEGYDGISYVTFEVVDHGDSATLRLTHEGLETFPAIADFARQNFEAGWTHIIGKSLMEFLGS
jgi:uncharacterized protein YndB with AHSA1/START domain